jgi:uncharacterized membrane protein YcaP (DUF421 family)
MSQLREQGVESLSAVKRCYLEGDGHVSVIKRESGGGDGGGGTKKQQPGAS